VDARQLGQALDHARVFFQHVREITGDAHVFRMGCVPNGVCSELAQFYI